MPKLIMLLALLAAAPAAAAAEFRALEVSRDHDVYRVDAEVYLAAPPDAVFAVLTDYEHLTRVSPSVVVSRPVQQLDANTVLVYTDTRVCAFLICRHLKQLEKLSATPPADLTAEVVPREEGNVKSGSALLHLAPEGAGTLMHWQLTLEPGFWIPPLIGPPLVERSLKAEGRRTAEGVEKLARARAHLPPLDAEEHEQTKHTQDPGGGA